MSLGPSIARGQTWKARAGNLVIRVRSAYPNGCWRVENMQGIKPPAITVTEQWLRETCDLVGASDGR